MKRLERLEFIYLYELFMHRNQELGKAVKEGRSEDEIALIREQADRIYTRISKHLAVTPYQAQ